MIMSQNLENIKVGDAVIFVSVIKDKLHKE